MAEAYGWVSNIQRFCVHDGDGIRTTVFMQGCALRCLWCCNPENMSQGPKIKYNDQLCSACGRCVAACPNGALEVRDGKLYMDRTVCTGCGKCVSACPNGARSLCGAYMSASEVLAQVKRDVAFYRKSGGGVTLSGGECLLQPDFSYALLTGAKEHFIHTAIETCGQVDWQAFDLLRKYIDQFMFDIKHTDPVKHQELTGQSNARILDNISRLASHGARIILRTPVIVGCNDDLDTLLEIARIAKENKVERLELLPYHKLGIRKYEMLGLQYGGAAFETPTDDALEARTSEMRKIFPHTIIKKM